MGEPKCLRCENLQNPLGIDTLRPRLSWIIEAQSGKCTEAQRGIKQTGYQILVASSEDLLAQDKGDLWDSGEVPSDRCTFIDYAGRPLQSRMCCYWKVRVWCSKPESGTASGGRPENTECSVWSERSIWSMGLLGRDDWSAKWIGSPSDDKVEPAPLLRKSFSLKKDIKRATAYICGLGYYELSLNGKKVGDHVLDPKVTQYDCRVLYVTYDVTKQVREGMNAAGVMLGNGWYNYHVKNPWHFDEAPWRNKPRMLLQLEVEYADGSTQSVISDGSWKYSTGPVQFDGMLNGEVYDARLEKDGWDTAGYDDSKWVAAKVVTAPKGRLVPQMSQPIRVVGVIKPVSLKQPKPGVFVYDLGQNIAGTAQLTVEGPSGVDLKIQYAELLHPDGTLNQTNINTFCESGDFQTEHYILKGRGVETWHARFMYYGFQYVQITGFPGELKLENLAGLVMRSDVESAGSFECSNELLNKIHSCNLWSYLNNFFGYPTDCPNREKIGWTGDAHIAAETGLYNCDPSAVYAQWLRDFHDEMRPNGELPGIIPTGGWGYERWGGPAWCSALILIPWYMYLYRGDAGILQENYEYMKRYVDYMTTASPGSINAQGMGDWFPAKTETPVDVTSTSYYYIDALVLSRIAGVLGRKDDSTEYARLADKVKKAFNSKFFDRKTGQYGGGTQTSNACALHQGLVESSDVDAVVKNLLESVVKNDNHFDGGIIGAKCILHALTDTGHVDIAYKLAAQSTWPSWGDMVRQGATTLWEGWNADIGTHNHVMLGDISAWFYEVLAGILPDPAGPGFKRIIIKPRVAGDLSWVKAYHDSPYGRIISNWNRKGSSLTMDVTVPINTTATVHVPSMNATGVMETDKDPIKAEGITFLKMENGAAVFEVGSGSYRFSSTVHDQ